MTRRITERTGLVLTGTLLATSIWTVPQLEGDQRAGPRAAISMHEDTRITAAVDREAALTAISSAQPRYALYGQLQEVDGDQLYAEGRELLRNGRFAEAAAVFESLRESFPNSVLVGDSFYYQAFALYRYGSHQSTDSAEARRALQRAERLIDRQASEHSEAITRSDAQSLSMRLSAAMAERGDTEARSRVDSRAQVACGDEEDDMKALALSALMNMDPERAVPLLTEIIQDRNECNGELRGQAVFMLSQHDADGVVELLMDIAYRNPDPDREVREAAVHWLGQSNRPEAVDALFAILEGSDDKEIQEGALFALSQTNDPRASAALRNLAQDESASSELRSTAIFWLVQQDRDAAAFLIELFGTIEDSKVREQIIFSVGQAKTAESRAWLRSRALDETEDAEVRGQAVFWMSQSGGDDAVTVRDLKSIYDSARDSEVREQALFGLSQVKSTESVDALMDIARNDPDREMRSSAVFFLGQSNDPRVAEFLMSLIRG